MGIVDILRSDPLSSEIEVDLGRKPPSSKSPKIEIRPEILI